jgi:hypothetical protein
MRKLRSLVLLIAVMCSFTAAVRADDGVLVCDGSQTVESTPPADADGVIHGGSPSPSPSLLETILGVLLGD